MNPVSGVVPTRSRLPAIEYLQFANTYKNATYCTMHIFRSYLKLINEYVLIRRAKECGQDYISQCPAIDNKHPVQFQRALWWVGTGNEANDNSRITHSPLRTWGSLAHQSTRVCHLQRLQPSRVHGLVFAYPSTVPDVQEKSLPTSFT